MTDVDVVVVGAGAMGACTAWWLARRGVDVTLIEQFEPGHTRGSSHGGSRIFRLAYSDPYYVALALEALELWPELEADAGETLLDRTGGVDHGDPAEVGAVAGALEAAGRRVERLAPGAASERWPGMRFEELVVYSPDSGRVRAEATVRALIRRAAELGARTVFGERVVDFDAAARVVRTAAGRELRARRSIVLTAGAWVGKVVDGAGAAGGAFALPPLRVTEERVFHFAPAAGDRTGWPSFIHYPTSYPASPAHYGLLTPGEGVKVAEHHTGADVDPDTRTFAADPAARSRVATYVRDWLPGLVPEPVSETTCLYTSTPDQSFVIDRTGDLVVGSACSGHGFKFTPVVGRRLADLALA